MTEDDIQDAKHEGCSAAKSGESMDSCPYDAGENRLRKAWSDGWREFTSGNLQRYANATLRITVS